jgi:hypothetical protein
VSKGGTSGQTMQIMNLVSKGELMGAPENIDD